MRKQRRELFTLIVITCIPAAIFLIFIFSVGDDLDYGEDYGERIFDPARWIEAGRQDAPRNRMADDLLRRYHLVGMSRKQIDDLLGPPTDTDKFSRCDYVYWLGPERSFMQIDSEWLCIDFDDDDVVARARMLTD